MKLTSSFAIPLLSISLIASVAGGDLSTYRGMQFGMNIEAVAKRAGTTPADARTIHARPAIIQEMDWQPRPPVVADPIKTDPVREGVLCFYNGELSRIVVSYDRQKVEGLTPEDLIEGISTTYGPATRPGVELAYRSIYGYGEVVPVIARWEDPQYAYNLVRTTDQSSFVMVLYSKRLDALAQSASLEAVKLEAASAPQREIEKQKQKDHDEGLLLQKARVVNKPNFRP